jgi:flagellar L-ring protein precursor FlgH
VSATASDKKAAKDAKAAEQAASENYDALFARYLASARLQPVTVSPNAASWINNLMSDPRARHVNDLVTVNVIESITASGTADSSVTKTTNSAVGLPNIFGLESKLPAAINPAALVSGKQDTSFKGTGATNRAGQLTAVMTARVSEVLPNGDLVIEGVHEIEINGDRQIVVLTGVARVTDITPANIVASTSLGQLQIRYFGRGLMKDSLSPGWLVRVLNKVF